MSKNPDDEESEEIEKTVEESEEEDDEEEDNKKSQQSKKDAGSKKIVTVPQNSNSPSKKSSKDAKKITIDAGGQNAVLPTFNEMMKSDPNEELKAPSLHYSEKYGKNSQKSQKSKNTQKSQKLPKIKPQNSKLPTFTEFIKSEPGEELEPPSVHYSEKYGKNSQKSQKTQKTQKSQKPQKLPKIENPNANLPTFNEFMNSDPNEELNAPSIHYSEKYSKASKKSKRIEEQKIKEDTAEKQKEEGKDMITFENYMKDDPEMSLPVQAINYNKRYADADQESKKEIKSRQSNKSKATSKKSKPSTLYMYQDLINGDPDKQYNLKDIDYNRRYLISEEQSNKSKKTEKRELLGNVMPERVIVTDENEKANLPKLFCSICNKFPLQPSVCSECKNIFCSECLKGKSKCPKCNSIYKHTDLDEELGKLFSLCRIICTYLPCGCNEQLPPNELLNHEEMCKNKPKICENCNEKMTYGKYLNHFKQCKLDYSECEVCGYKDSVKEFEKTNKKVEHIKHLLLPEIENIVKNEVEKAVLAINDSLDRREANKEPKDDKFEQEFRQKLLDIQQLLLNIQPKDFIGKKDDIGIMTKASYLDRKIKNIKLVLTVPSQVDNAFDCNNKYCVLHTFTNDNFIIYPNMKYGINSYNLSNEKDLNIIPNAFESNITCMSSCSNSKKSLTYFAASSYDRSIKVYSVENGWKKIKTYKEIFDDYSNFCLDLFCSNNQLILLAANENLKQVKVLYPEENKESEQNLIKSMTHKNKILCLKHNPANEEEFFIGTEEGVHLYNIFNLVGENDDKNKNVEQEREFIDKNEDKAKHVCITFIEEEKNYMIEGDSIGIMRVWSIKDGELRKKIKRGILKYQISSLDSWSGRFIIGGTKDGKLVIFDIFDGIAFGEFGEHKGYVYSVKVSEHWKYEKIITSCGFDGQLKIWASLDN